jgi:hypothetical protein
MIVAGVEGLAFKLNGGCGCNHSKEGGKYCVNNMRRMHAVEDFW